MDKKILYGFAGIMILSVLVAAVYAFPGKSGTFSHFKENESRNFMGRMNHMNPEINSGIRDAIRSGDYQAYLAAFQKEVKPMNESKFNTAHDQMQEMESKMSTIKEKMDKVDAAVKAGDYNAWLDAIKDGPMTDKLKAEITQEKFNALVEISKARDEGDYDKVKQLIESSGIEMNLLNHARGNIMGHGPGKWMNHPKSEETPENQGN